jgi:hypothetical protein
MTVLALCSLVCHWCFLGVKVPRQKVDRCLLFWCLLCMFTFPGPFSFSWSHEHLVIFPFLSLFWGFPTIMGLASFMSFSFLSHRWIADLRFFVAVTSCLFFFFTKHHVNMSIGNLTYDLYIPLNCSFPSLTVYQVIYQTLPPLLRLLIASVSICQG